MRIKKLKLKQISYTVFQMYNIITRKRQNKIKGESR